MPSSESVAIYIRVSTQDQIEGHSLAAQESILSQEVRLRGKLVYKVYQDAGISGIREDRKGLNELLRDARKGCFAEVLVWTVSRISRKLSYLLQVVEEIKDMGITFRSYSEDFDITTPMGQFALTMMGAVAQMQRESWMESSHIGMEKRAKSGRWGGGMMLGYKMVPDSGDLRGGGRLEILPQEAETVRRIFALYAQGLGYKAIVNRLNQEGRTGKKGSMFSSGSVRRILTNAVYVGKTRFGAASYDGLQEPIIPEDLWQEVQERLGRQAHTARKQIQREYLLSGLLKCPVCGSGMVPTHTKNRRKDGSYRIHHYYICGAYLNRGRAVCKANSVRAGEAEERVLKWLSEFLTHPFWQRQVTEVIRKKWAVASELMQEEQNRIIQRLTEIVQRQGELLRRYEEDLLDKEAFLIEMQLLRAEKTAGQAKLEQNEAETPTADYWSKEDVQGAFAAFRQVLKQATADKKRTLLRQLITGIQVNEHRQVSAIDLRLIPILGIAKAAESVSLRVSN